MMVKVIDVADDGTETERCECDLLDCYPGPMRPDPEYAAAWAELMKTGRFMTGGGAAPTVLLKMVSP